MIDRTAPTVTNVTSAKANGTYAAGAIIPITVTFSKSVVVTGIPRLTLETGASDAIVDYSSGSGTANLTFTYTVAAGQTSTDLDYASTSALALNGGTIADAMGNPALLTLAAPGVAGSLGANKNIVVDTTLTVTINQASSQADPTKTSPINFAVVFSAAVSDFATVDVTLSGTAGATTATVTGSGTTYNVAVSGMTTSGTVIASIVEGVAHAGTSPNSASTSTDSTVTWDVTAPTVTVEQAVGQPDPTSATPINFTVVFSESVTGFATGDVTLSGTAGATTATVTGSGSTYNVAVSGMTTNGTVVASVAASKAVDLVGNLNVASTSSDNSVTYDTALSVTINQASGQADPASVSPVNFTVVFSESVTGFATGDVTLSGTAGATTATVTGSGSTYNVAVSGMTRSGTIIASIAADRAHATIGGHPNRVSTSTDNSVTYVLPSKLTFTSQPGTSTKDVAFPIQPVVAIQNAAGTTATNVPATTVTLAIGTNPAAGTLTCTNGLTRTTVAGVATFSGCRINNAGVGYTLTATATSLTGATSTAFTVAAPAAQIALTTSSSVITWGNGIVLTTQFGVNGGSKTFQLQGTRDGVTWAPIATLTTNSAGWSSFPYRPVTNLFYRAVFAGTPDLQAANSATVRTVVRQIALMRPTNGGAVRSIARNTSITFTTTVRPARPELAQAVVSFYFYRLSGGSYVLRAKRDVLVDAVGKARTTFRFTSPGRWFVRSAANPTPYNANSVPTPRVRYIVR